MPFKISRVPRGLTEVLSAYGGVTPGELEDRARGVIDLLQFYGLSQVQRLQDVNPTMAEGGNFSKIVPANQYWVVYQMGIAFAKTATMTAFSFSIGLGPNGSSVSVMSRSFEPYGATENGTVSWGEMLPYPRLLLPGWAIDYRLDILGTDATANVSMASLVGILG